MRCRCCGTDPREGNSLYCRECRGIGFQCEREILSAKKAWAAEDKAHGLIECCICGAKSARYGYDPDYACKPCQDEANRQILAVARALGGHIPDRRLIK